MNGTVECLEAVDYYINLIKTKAGIVIPKPVIKFDLRGTIAGRGGFIKKGGVLIPILRFQPVLLDQNAEHFVKQTVGHEVAHIASFVKHGFRIEPHGQEWRHVMWHLSLPAKRCHSYDTSTVTGVRKVSLAREITE